MINAVIIDDEENFIESLDFLIKKNFPNVNIIGSATSVADGISLLKLTKPNLVFLDINLNDGDAFDILDKVENRNFEIIFTTASSEYAIRAFEFSALHYLLKPMDLDKLRDAMERYFKVKSPELSEERLEILKSGMLNKSQKILLTSTEGMSIYNVSDIVRCESENNYTRVYFEKKNKILVSKPLLSFNKLLVNFNFVRIHNQHLINLRYVQKFLTGRKPTVLLTDGTELPVSQTHRADFAESLKRYANTL